LAKKRAPKVTIGGQPVLTYALIGVNLLVYLMQLASNDLLTEYLTYAPYRTRVFPWEMITSGFAHASIMHIAFNMYSLYLFGTVLEPMLGRARFFALYMISLFGGSVAVELLAPDSAVLGASGAIFGLMGAYLVVLRSLRLNSGQITGVIALNLVIGFIPGSGISWQAHVGGLIAGAAIAYVYSKTRAQSQRNIQWLMVAGIAVLLVGIALVSAPVFTSNG
jgi:membrane associated rhomboid family serine protease